jgi:aldehyde:ferredoxin oxidoreductase
MEKIIRVNMEDLTVRTEKCPDEYQVLGGRGLSARILNREVQDLTHPLGDENKLLAASGF